MNRLVFMSHPVAGDIPGNLARARRWLDYLFDEYRELVVVAPWIHDVESIPLRDAVADERERAIARNLVTLRRCDGIVLCGGRVTNGMRRELQTALLMELDVIDLVHLGAEPPRAGLAR